MLLASRSSRNNEQLHAPLSVKGESDWGQGTKRGQSVSKRERERPANFVSVALNSHVCQRDVGGVTGGGGGSS